MAHGIITKTHTYAISNEIKKNKEFLFDNRIDKYQLNNIINNGSKVPPLRSFRATFTDNRTTDLHGQ